MLPTRGGSAAAASPPVRRSPSPLQRERKRIGAKDAWREAYTWRRAADPYSSMEQRKDRRRPLCLLTRMTVFRLLCLNSLTYHGIHSPFKGRSSGGGSGSNTRSSSGSGRSSSGSQGGVMAAAIPEGAPGWREPPRMSASTIKVSNVSGARVSCYW